ncbi:MAG: glycosyltransferase family 39 protein [Chloroflexota bacterium]
MAILSTKQIQHSRVRRWVDSRRLLSGVLFLGVLTLYLSTLTQVHTFDALSYIIDVERKPWNEIFHPHHLAYGPLGMVALAVGHALGFDGGAAVSMQLVNAFAGALGVVFFFSIVWNVTCRVDIAFVVALLLAGSYAYWYYAIEVEVYTVAALFLLTCLSLLIHYVRSPSRYLLVLLGLAQGGAVLFHQTNVLLCVPVLLVYLVETYRLSQKADHRNIFSSFIASLRQWYPYALTLAFVVGIPYLFVGLGVSGFRTWDELMTWLTQYANTGWWGGPVSLNKWYDLGVGWAETVAQPDGALLGLLLLGLFIIHLRGIFRTDQLLATILLVWLLTYGAFFLWWEPDNIEFWIASLPPLLLLFALALRETRPWRYSIAAALAIGVTIATINYDSIDRRGDPTTDLQRIIVSSIGQYANPNDPVLVPDGLLELYLPYYENHNKFLSLNQALFEQGGDWSQACADIHSQIETNLQAGSAVIVANEILQPPATLLARHNLTQNEVDRCFAQYLPALEQLAMPEVVPVYHQIPRAQEMARNEGWQFTTFAMGWQVANVSSERFEEGWQFVPHNDPSFTSPLLELDAQSYSAIDIRMANETNARDAQLFYAQPDQQIREEHSIQWMLEPTSEATTYRLDLQDAPGWEGTIARLRVDPVGNGDGGSMRIESIQLIP